ncbi:MAG: hypothetical protein H7199_07975 [Burkholderiales bacterium]|nr:hypothetical protein [Flavobacterium sp.]
MIHMRLKYDTYLALIFKNIAACYFLVSFIYFFFFNAGGGGDESLFVNDLLLIKSQGWIAAIEKSISIPYMLLAYPFSFFLEEYMALRLASLLLTFLILVYFFKIAKIRNSTFYFYFLFYAATSSFFFSGTNDICFFSGLIVFFAEVFYFIENKRWNHQILAFSGLVLSFFTRELFVVYLPVIVLAFYFLYKKGHLFFTAKMIFPALLFVVFLVLNGPSLLKNHQLSYDDKAPPKEMNVTWSQRQYLAQLMVNKGELPNFKHPSWKVTQDYLKQNGPDALPKTTLKSLTFDYQLTIIEFFKDLYYSLFFGFRQLGLILFVIFYLWAMEVKKGKILNAAMFVPIATFIMLSLFSFIIISFIELRWLIAVFTTSILFYDAYQAQNKINRFVILANYCILICFSMYGLYKLLPKLTAALI